MAAHPLTHLYYDGGSVGGFISSRLMAAYTLDGHVLHLIAKDRTEDGATRFSYVLEHGDEVIFEGDDFVDGTYDESDYGSAARNLLGHLTVQEDDIEDEFFDRYTPEQIAWRDEYAEDLHIYALEPEDEDIVYERAEEAIPAEVNLIYVGQGDDLSNKQVQALFNGEQLWEDDAYAEWESEASNNGAWHVIEEHVDEDDLKVLREVNRIDDLLLLVKERDQSDPVADLVRATGEKWMRYRIDVDVTSVWGDDAETLGEDIVNIAEALGIDASERHDWLLELISDSGSGALHILWHGDIEPMVDACSNPETPKTVTWTNPYILVFDAMNGSGHMAEFSGTITLPFKQKNLRLDVRGVNPGYSYSDETCGGLYSTADTTVEVTETTTTTTTTTT